MQVKGARSPSPTRLGLDARAKVIAEVSGQYESKIAALESEVSKLQSSNQPAPALPGAMLGSSFEAQGHNVRTRAMKWYNMVKAHTIVHDQLATLFLRRARVVNVILVALNTIIGSAIFSSLDDAGDGDVNYKVPLRTAAGVLSMLVAVLSAVSFQLNYNGRADAHKSMKRLLGRIKHRMEILVEVRSVPLVKCDRLDDEWSAVIKDWEDLEADAPHVSADWLREAQNQIANDFPSGESNFVSARCGGLKVKAADRYVEGVGAAGPQRTPRREDQSEPSRHNRCQSMAATPQSMAM